MDIANFSVRLCRRVFVYLMPHRPTTRTKSPREQNPETIYARVIFSTAVDHKGSPHSIHAPQAGRHREFFAN